jgi:hypothetical protein
LSRCAVPRYFALVISMRPVLRKDGRVPNRIVRREPDKPAKHQIAEEDRHRNRCGAAPSVANPRPARGRRNAQRIVRAGNPATATRAPADVAETGLPPIGRSIFGKSPLMAAIWVPLPPARIARCFTIGDKRSPKLGLGRVAHCHRSPIYEKSMLPISSMAPCRRSCSGGGFRTCNHPSCRTC